MIPLVSWPHFTYFALPAVACWMAAAVAAFVARKTPSWRVMGLHLLGTLFFLSFVILFWIGLRRPPLRTLGETRLWYVFFMGLAGILTYARWKFKWILSFATLLQVVFICLNLFKPQLHDQTLMPALQSFWFIPHVTLYMFSYALLACAFLLAVAGLCKRALPLMPALQRLCRAGFTFFTIGLLLGALWAQQAWGTYWNWDPKETWAAVTWLGFAGVEHLCRTPKVSPKYVYLLVIISFACLQICWYGVNFLPWAAQSLHAY